MQKDKKTQNKLILQKTDWQLTRGREGWKVGKWLKRVNLNGDGWWLDFGNDHLIVYRDNEYVAHLKLI